MKLLHFLVAINLLVEQLNCAVLIPSNQHQLKFAKKDQEQTNFILSNEIVDDLEFCKAVEYLHKFISHENKSQTIWVTWNRTKAGERAVLPNICSVESGLPLQRRCRHLGAISEWEKYNNQTVLIDCRISMFCRADKFDHYVILNNGEIQAHKNSWKQVKIGDYSSLQDLCLQPNGLQLTRKCYYNAKEQRAQWAPIDHLRNTKCFQHIRQQAISNELNVLHGNISITNYYTRDMTARRLTARNLLALLRKPKLKLLPADVHLISDILKTLVIDFPDLQLSRDILSIAHNIMSTESIVLRMSAEVNATNTFLETFENYIDVVSESLDINHYRYDAPDEAMSQYHLYNDNETGVEALNLANVGVYAHISRYISVFYVNPSRAAITGIAIYNSKQQQKYQMQPQQQTLPNQIRYDSLNDLYYRFIYMNESVSDLLQESHLELASFIPMSIWIDLQHRFFKTFYDTSFIVFKIYANDALFVEQNLFRSRKPFSKVLSISIPGYSDNLPGPIPFILRHHKSTPNLKPDLNTGCGYWNYSTWVRSGVHTNTTQYSASEDLILCSTNHLTQFSYLLGGSFRQNDLSDEILVTVAHQQALDIISLVGCSLSMLGLLGIWITAVLFKAWRSQSSNKILLNMCVALTLQMALFLFVNTDDISKALVENHNYTKCIVLGALLQYSLLVLFAWMLIVAVLQFQRYVTVIGIYRPKHYIIKSALIAWSLPLIPTLSVALSDSKSYIPSVYQLATNTGICYPSGKGLHFGVVLPASLVIVANLSIFIYVFYSISHTLSMSMQRHEKQMVIKQIRLSILLFFLLGLSWIFGLFAFMKAGIVFSYLFCLTATLQGFVLFIYFVIIDDNARNAWQNMLCSSCVKKSSVKKTTELQSMATASTSLTHDVNTSRDH